MVGKRSSGLLGLKPNASKVKLSLATMGLLGWLFLLWNTYIVLSVDVWGSFVNL